MTGAHPWSGLQRLVMRLAGGLSVLGSALGLIMTIAAYVAIDQFHSEVLRRAAGTGNPAVMAEVQALTHRDQFLKLTILLQGLVSVTLAVWAYILLQRNVLPCR